jgi:hypothetical protein
MHCGRVVNLVPGNNLSGKQPVLPVWNFGLIVIRHYLRGLLRFWAAWITVNAIRHHTETARVDEAERALNEYAVAILEVIQKYEAVPVALSHEARQDAERRFQALNDATDAPTIRTAMIDSVIGGDQPMIAQFLNCCRFVSRASAASPTLPGLDLLNPKLVFGTAWFWTLPEVHDVQEEIDALSSQFRRYIGVNDG